ncbi:TetR/AcrR family transcriptional regulator [Pseudonocardia sp. NPDC049154]|uniref:TetR/AcrR family transcriptional regulator n=1 Tax=Pseudonocardia sp. NPDC049154 TaxID=3155501 RepID=UPI0033CCB0B6
MPDSRPPGRPMSEEREHALLDAALTVLGRVGYDRLTVGAVCVEAGASTKTAYRRWADKDELMTAALQRAVLREVDARTPPLLTGSLRTDLITNIGHQARSWRASPELVIGLVVASRVAGDLGALARELIRRYESGYSAMLVDAAAERGEIGPDVDAELLADLARSFFLHELLVRGAPPDDDRIATFVERVLLPYCGLPADRQTR